MAEDGGRGHLYPQPPCPISAYLVPVSNDLVPPNRIGCVVVSGTGHGDDPPLCDALAHEVATPGGGLTGFLHQRTGPVTATSLVEDTVTLLISLPDGTGDDVALLALSVPGRHTAPHGGVAATAHTVAAPEHFGQE